MVEWEYTAIYDLYNLILIRSEIKKIRDYKQPFLIIFLKIINAKNLSFGTALVNT